MYVEALLSYKWLKKVARVQLMLEVKLSFRQSATDCDQRICTYMHISKTTYPKLPQFYNYM